MSAIITFIPSLVLPSLFQIVLTGGQFVILPIIEVITSVIYMALTAMGCGGCGLGGGTIGALGGGGICTMIMGYFAAGMTVLGGMFGGVFGLTGGGIAGGIGGFSIGDLIQVMPPIFGIMMDLFSSAVSFLMGLL